jgi:hypothetical protein
MTSWRRLIPRHRLGREHSLDHGNRAKGSHEISAHISVHGCSGVRNVRVRDFQFLSDNGPDCSGYDLGPTAAELQLSALGNCLAETMLAQAAILHIPVGHIEIEVTGEVRLGPITDEEVAVPQTLHSIAYSIQVQSSASSAEIATLHAAVQRSCPILQLLIQPQTVNGRIDHHDDHPRDGAVSLN